MANESEHPKAPSKRPFYRNKSQINKSPINKKLDEHNGALAKQKKQGFRPRSSAQGRSRIAQRCFDYSAIPRPASSLVRSAETLIKKAQSNHNLIQQKPHQIKATSYNYPIKNSMSDKGAATVLSPYCTRKVTAITAVMSLSIVRVS